MQYLRERLETLKIKQSFYTEHSKDLYLSVLNNRVADEIVMEDKDGNVATNLSSADDPHVFAFSSRQIARGSQQCVAISKLFRLRAKNYEEESDLISKFLDIQNCTLEEFEIELDSCKIN